MVMTLRRRRDEAARTFRSWGLFGYIFTFMLGALLVVSSLQVMSQIWPARLQQPPEPWGEFSGLVKVGVVEEGSVLRPVDTDEIPLIQGPVADFSFHRCGPPEGMYITSERTWTVTITDSPETFPEEIRTILFQENDGCKDFHIDVLIPRNVLEYVGDSDAIVSVVFVLRPTTRKDYAPVAIGTEVFRLNGEIADFALVPVK